MLYSFDLCMRFIMRAAYTYYVSFFGQTDDERLLGYEDANGIVMAKLNKVENDRYCTHTQVVASGD